jgi:phage gp29-like protein
VANENESGGAVANAIPSTPVNSLIGGQFSPPPEAVAARLGKPDVQQVSQTDSLITPFSVYQYKQSRFNPISFLTPESLTQQLSEWATGTMRSFSLTMDAIENRDAVSKSVLGKLKMTVSRREYEIVEVEGADQAEAQAHSEALRYFYSNLQCTNAVDRNQIGGFHSLIHQMMDAGPKKYAVHEMILDPRGSDLLTAKFIFVPLWFFENRTGSLRFAGNYQWDGEPLRDGQWMVTVGEGIMEAVSVAWMYKTIAIRDWLIYNERNGMPVPIGLTNHAQGSAGWNALQDVLSNVGPNSAIIASVNDKIEKIDFGSTGQLPYEPLVDYMDRAICALARGADLSTISSHGGGSSGGRGASLQGEEAEMIEQHYGQIISETLNHYVDIPVLKWHFGPSTTPKAYVKLNIPKKKDVQLEIEIDQFLLQCGAKLGIEDMLERYNRVEAQEGEPTATPPPTGQQGQDTFGAKGALDISATTASLNTANAIAQSKVFLRNAMVRLAKDTSLAVRPLRERVLAISEMSNAEQMQAALLDLKDKLPSMLKTINKSPANGQALREIIATMAINGLTSGLNTARHVER